MTPIRAGGRAVYMSLRQGLRAAVDWEEIPQSDQDDFVAAFEAGLAAMTGAANEHG